MRVTNINEDFSFPVGGVLVAPGQTITAPDSAFLAIKDNQDLLATGPYSGITPRGLRIGRVVDPAGSFTLFNAEFGQYYLPAPGVFDANGIYQGSPPPSYTFATLPSPSSLPIGTRVMVTDVGDGQVGAGGGTFWVPNATRWKLDNNLAVVDAVDTANTSVGNAEFNLNPNGNEYFGGMFGLYDELDLRFTVTKSGNSADATIRVRFGPAKSVVDPLLFTITDLSATNQNGRYQLGFKRISATQIQFLGNFGASAGTLAAPVTVSNMDSVTQYLSITSSLNTGAETVSLIAMRTILSSTDS